MFEFWKRPLTQVILVGCVLFTQPGMFDAITGIGAGGQKASLSWLTNQALATLYGCFAVSGFVGGSIVNVLGAKITFFLGTIGYTLYIGSLWSLDRTGNTGFVVAGGALCGLSAGLLWSVHGMVIMSYPLEKDKAKGFALTWSLLSIGASIGGLISLLKNLNTADTSGVSTGTYLAFIIIMLVGCCISLLLLNPQDVRRSDGSALEQFERTNLKQEFIDTIKLFTDWKLLALFPAFFASNFFYSYQFEINAFYFSLRTRALNSMIYWLTQVVGTFGLGLILDNSKLKRRTRGLIGLAITCLLVIGTWIGGAVFQTTFTHDTPSPNVDFKSKNFGGPFVLYFMYGISDAMWQGWCYWIMGTLSNESYKLARCAGYYKAVQSAGSAISFGISSLRIPFNRQFGANFGMMLFSMPLMILVAMKVTQTTYGEEEEVFVPLENQSFHESENHLDIEKPKSAVVTQVSL